MAAQMAMATGLPYRDLLDEPGLYEIAEEILERRIAAQNEPPLPDPDALAARMAGRG